MKLSKFFAALAVLASLGFNQSASATSVTYIADAGQNGGTFSLIAPDPNRPTWHNNITVNNLSVTVDDALNTVTFNGVVNFNTYTLTSNPANNAPLWIGASQGNYSVSGIATGLNVANNNAGVGQYVAAFYGTGTGSTHTSDIALYGLQGQNWCSVPNGCSVTNGNQYIGAWALANPGFGNLAFGISNLGNNTYNLVAWYRDGFTPQVYQIDLGVTLRGPGSPPPGGAVPEPATMALLASGAIPLLRRKMKKA